MHLNALILSSTIRVNRVCQHCKKDFTARTTVTRYCSTDCARKAYKQRHREKKIEVSNRQTFTVQTADLRKVQAKDILTVREAATLLGCSVRTTYRLIDAGTLQAANLSERLTRIRRVDIDYLLTNN